MGGVFYCFIEWVLLKLSMGEKKSSHSFKVEWDCNCGAKTVSWEHPDDWAANDCFTFCAKCESEIRQKDAKKV